MLARVLEYHIIQLLQTKISPGEDPPELHLTIYISISSPPLFFSDLHCTFYAHQTTFSIYKVMFGE